MRGGALYVAMQLHADAVGSISYRFCPWGVNCLLSPGAFPDGAESERGVQNSVPPLRLPLNSGLGPDAPPRTLAP